MTVFQIQREGEQYIFDPENKTYSEIAIYKEATSATLTADVELTLKIDRQFKGRYKIRIANSVASCLTSSDDSRVTIEKILINFLNYYQDNNSGKFFLDDPSFVVDVKSPRLEVELRNALDPKTAEKWLEMVKFPSLVVGKLTLLLEIDQTVLNFNKSYGRINKRHTIKGLISRDQSHRSTSDYFADELAFNQLKGMLENGHRLYIITGRNFPFSHIWHIFKFYGIELDEKAYMTRNKCNQQNFKCPIECINSHSFSTDTLYLVPATSKPKQNSQTVNKVHTYSTSEQRRFPELTQPIQPQPKHPQIMQPKPKVTPDKIGVNELAQMLEHTSVDAELNPIYEQL